MHLSKCLDHAWLHGTKRVNMKQTLSLDLDAGGAPMAASLGPQVYRPANKGSAAARVRSTSA